MKQIHTISLTAQEIFDPETGLPDSDFICSPLDIFVRKARQLNYYEGDNAAVQLTDGACFEVLFENDAWVCSHFIAGRTRDDSICELIFESLTTSYGTLEDAIIDIVARRDYLSAVN